MAFPTLDVVFGLTTGAIDFLVKILAAMAVQTGHDKACVAPNCQSAFNGDPLSSSNGDPPPRGGTGGEAPPPGQPAGMIHPNPFYADHPWLPFLRCPMRRSCYSQRAGSN